MTKETVLSTEFGKIRVRATQYGVYAEVGDEGGKAHINDEHAALVLKGQEYIGAMNIHAKGEIQHSHFTERPQWTEATTTAANKLRQAVFVTVMDWVQTEQAQIEIHQAQWVALESAHERAVADAHEAAAALQAASEKVTRLRRELAQAQKALEATA